ncbi:MAG: glycoside hydrolase family 2 protein [Lachnospiraceae bacterium]|nr:glycoside hydrolase family 2 protein [Lachnospiraceae bacterium]
MSKKICLNNDWGYTDNFTEDLLGADFDESSLQNVRLPHTVKETPFNYFDESEYQMVSGYRRIIKWDDTFENKNVFLNVGAVAHYAEVYLNGELLGTHACGYTAFQVELTGKLNKGDNILVIKVDSRESLNQPPFGYVIDYMTYGGIYRSVYLYITEKEYIEDVFVKANIPEHAVLPGHLKDNRLIKDKLPGFIYEGEIETDIDLNGLHDFEGHIYDIRQRVYDYTSMAKKSAEDCEDTEDLEGLSEVAYNIVTVDKKKCDKFTIHTDVDHVTLWDVSYPKLYIVVTELLKDEVVIDKKVTTTGFKSCYFNSMGFYLNGRKLKIRGLNRHQSYPYVGYAMPDNIQALDADIMKYELGLNAVRTSHYPQSHAFIERCDEIGLLVFTEIPGWQHIGDEDWKKQAVSNVSDMVKEYRNHTSIILWGVRINESLDDDELYKKTNETAHKLDPTRPTGGVRYLKKSNLLEDVYTYNDFLHDGVRPGCDKKADVTSNMKKPYLISEYNGHMYPTKSYDDETHRLNHALRHVNVLNSVGSYKDIAGSFGWCMFDYNTHKDFGSGDRICYHGVMDMFRNPKLAAYVYESQQSAQTILKISSSFDIGEYPGSEVGDIYIFTNADSVKMYKCDSECFNAENSDNEFVFQKEYFRDDTYKYMKYSPIKLEEYKCEWGKAATVFKFEAIKNGKVVKTVIKSAPKSVKFDIKVNNTNLSEGDSYDAAMIRIVATDENGNQLPYFNEAVSFETSGSVSLIGPDLISLKGGMGGTFVKTNGTTGEGKLIIKSAQAGEQEIVFTVMK